MTSMTASKAFNSGNYLGETPLWCAREKVLYWINCENPPEIHRWSPDRGDHNVWPMEQRVGGIALASQDTLIVVLRDGVYEFNTADANLRLLSSSPLPEYVALHECQCDRQGRLWVGSYDHRFTAENRDVQGGSIFRLEGNKLVPVIDHIGVANGMAFSPDGTVMYVADSPTRRVEAFDLDTTTGALSNRRPFLKLEDGEGFIDGATVDAEGGYWLAAVGAGTLRRYLPDGSLDRVVELPVSNPTKPAFGGSDLETLFVTTTRMQIGPGSEANGDIYALKPGVKGLPESPLAG